MGCFDSIRVPCPKCGQTAEFQSKSGPCLLNGFDLADAPEDVLIDVNRHAPYTCEQCGTKFHVKLEDVPPPVIEPDRITDENLKEVLHDKGWLRASGHMPEDLLPWKDLVHDLVAARARIALLKNPPRQTKAHSAVWEEPT